MKKLLILMKVKKVTTAGQRCRYDDLCVPETTAVGGLMY